jgi:hypothetical protein
MDTTPTSTTTLLFISHAAMDKEIAHHLKEVIQRAYPSVDVFVSSDPEDLPVGDPWVEKILAALDRAKLVVVLGTERGLGRKWVWFEAGAGWDRRRKIITCCSGKTRKNVLPPPFSLHTAVDIDDVEGSRSFFSLLAVEFGAPDRQIEHDLFTREVARLDVRAEEREKYSVVEDEEKPFVDYRNEAVKKKLDEIGQSGRDLMRFVMTFGEVDNLRIYSAWRRGYEVGPTIKAVCDSGLVQKRPDRVNNIDVAWYLRANPDLGSLLKRLLFPISEQDSSPHFQM